MTLKIVAKKLLSSTILGWSQEKFQIYWKNWFFGLRFRLWTWLKNASKNARIWSIIAVSRSKFCTWKNSLYQTGMFLEIYYRAWLIKYRTFYQILIIRFFFNQVELAIPVLQLMPSIVPKTCKNGNQRACKRSS